jgi:sugar phosphate isomerase/epimerase
MKKVLISIGFIATLGGNDVNAQNNGPLYTAPLGFAPYTYRKSFPKGVAATLDTIKSMGFTEIEGGDGHGITAGEFKKLCNDRGIAIPGTGASYEDLLKDPVAVSNHAKTLGAGFVMCAWIPHHDGILTIDDARKAVADFNTAGKVLREHGITFCYHAHGYEFQRYENGTLLDYLITHTNPEYVSFEMDIFWIWFGGGDPVALMKKYGNRWKLMHLKDMRKGTAKNLTGSAPDDTNVALGSGELDIPAIVAEANAIGIRHFFIEDESDHPTQQVPVSVAFLKSLKKNMN